MKKNSNIKVLIVDDDFTIREVLKKLIIRTLGKVSIITSDNGINGLGLIELHNPDLVIVDSTLPEFAGAELVHSIKIKEGFSNARMMVLIHEDENFPKINDPSLVMFNKNDNNFVDKFVSYLNYTFSIGSPLIYRHNIQNSLIKRILKISNDCDLLMHRITKHKSILNIFRWFYWVLQQIYLSFLLTFFYLFSGGKVQESNHQDLRDLTSYRVRYYPTLTTLIIGLLIFLLQAGVFIASGFAVLHYNISQLVAQTSCPLPSAPDVINNQVVLTPDNVDGIIDCASLDIIVGSTGEIVIERYVTENSSLSGDWGITLLVNNLTVQNGGKITADGKGYTVIETESGNGKGGNSAGQSGGAGGGHGGAGGQGVEDSNNVSGFGGTPYGNNEMPTTLGSAGGNGGGSSSSYQQDWVTNPRFNANGTSFSEGLQTASTPGLELKSTPKPDVVTSGLVAWYKMDEETWVQNQQSAIDSIGSYNATVIGASTNTTSGYINRAGNFSSNGYLDLGNNFNPGTGDWTYSFRIKTSQTTRFDFGKRSTGLNPSDYGIIMSFNQGSVNNHEFRIGIETASFNSNISNNEWHTITLVRDATNSALVVYVDGQEVANVTGTDVQDISNNSSFYIARANDGLYFTGLIDDFRIYNRVITSQEVTEIDNFTGGVDYSSGEQTWLSEIIDAGELESIKFDKLTADWQLDGSDNITPKFQILGSATGSFNGEEAVFPASGGYYQNGGTYNINDNAQKTLSEINDYYKYWRLKVVISTGSNLSDTPKVNGITLSGLTMQTGDAQGGAGGGSLKIVATGSVAVNGIISANGLDGQALGTSSGGGGSGGSIWIEANSFTGNGIVRANGGTAAEVQYQGGGGGGGRIVMLCATSNGFTGSATVSPGVTANSQDGGIGTIIGPTCRPNAPSILRQYRSNQTTEIPVNGITTETIIVFAGNLSDVDTADTLSLQIEIRQLGENFTGVPNYTQVSPFSNPQACTTPTTNCGKVVVNNLERSAEFHWQARVRDNKGGYSQWVSFGLNDESERDVLVTGNPSTIQLVGGNNQTGLVNSILSNSLIVRVIDSEGFPVPGYTVNWSVINSAVGGQFTGGNAVTDNDGYSSRQYRLGTKTGTNIVRAAASGLSGNPIDFNFTGTPEAINKFTVTAPQFGINGQNFGPVTVTAYDQYDNIKVDYTGSPSVIAVKALDNSAASGTLSPSTLTFEAENNGVLILNNFSHNTVESIKIRVTDGSATGLSNSIAIVDTLGSCPDLDGIVDVNQNWVANTSNQGIFDCRGINIIVQSGAILL